MVSLLLALAFFSLFAVMLRFWLLVECSFVCVLRAVVVGVRSLIVDVKIHGVEIDFRASGR